MNPEPQQQYVVLPGGTLRGREDRVTQRTLDMLTSLAMAPAATASAPGALGPAPATEGPTVLREISRTGAKLVLARPHQLRPLQLEHPDLQIEPVVYYRLARAPRPTPRIDAAPASAAAFPRPTVRVRIVDAATGTPVVGADVRAFTDFERRHGAQAVTGPAGVAALDLGPSPVFVERLYAYPPAAGYWGTYRLGLQLADGLDVQVRPIDLQQPDALRMLLTPGRPEHGTGVKVAVVDTGSGPHPDLHVQGDADFGDGHGTHVAGIIASRGALPRGLPGIAPGATIQAYRVFDGHGVAANFDVANAIEQAVVDGCDLVNLSLTYEDGAVDAVVQSAIGEAMEAGVLCIVAAGNSGRRPVEFPANDPRTLGVSALGQEGSFPTGSIDELDLAGPRGKDPDHFIARFSNVGPEINLTAPGVGVISTMPGSGYGWQSGTSMACPAVTGATARLLSAHPGILHMRRDSTRADEIRRLALHAARTLGFPAALEGVGLAAV